MDSVDLIKALKGVNDHIVIGRLAGYLMALKIRGVVTDVELLDLVERTKAQDAEYVAMKASC
jgi:hypothetical protein